MARRRKGWASERMEFDSELWISYQASTELFPALEQASRRALTACAIYLGKQYQNAVPSRTVARSVAFRVAPPRMYVGPKDFRANFWESGTSPHRIESRGIRLKKQRRKYSTVVVGFQKGIRYLAIPVGGHVIFRSSANHPGGISAGHYLRKAGENSMPVLQEIAGKAFQDVFR